MTKHAAKNTSIGVLVALWLAASVSAQEAPREGLPAFSEATYGALLDPDLSDANLARYAADERVSAIRGERGCLAVDFDLPGWEQAGRQAEDPRAPRPAKRYRVSLDSSYPVPNHPDFARRIQEANQDPRYLIVPAHVFVTWRRADAQPGEHPFRYTREPDGDDEALARLRASPDAHRVERVSGYRTRYRVDDLWAIHARAQTAPRAIEARSFALAKPPEGFSEHGVDVHYRVERAGYSSAAEARLARHVQATYVWAEHGPVVVEVFVDRPPDELADHVFWSRVVHWEARIEEVAAQRVVAGAKAEGDRIGRIPGPEVGAAWRTAEGLVVLVSWRRPQRAEQAPGRPAPSPPPEPEGAEPEPRPQALLEAYLHEHPSALAAEAVPSAASWAAAEMPLFWEALRAPAEAEQTEPLLRELPWSIPILSFALVPGLSPTERLARHTALTPFVEGIGPQDFSFDAARGGFLFREAAVHAAPRLELPAVPMVTPEVFDALPDLSSPPLWQTAPDAVARGRMHPSEPLWTFQARADGGGHVFFLSGDDPRRLLKLDAETGRQLGELSIPPHAQTDHLRLVEGKLACDLFRDWVLSVDPQTLADRVPAPPEVERAFLAAIYGGLAGGEAGPAVSRVLGEELLYLSAGRDTVYACGTRKAGRSNVNTLYAFARDEHRVRWSSDGTRPPPVEWRDLTLFSTGAAWHAVETLSGQLRWSLGLAGHYPCLGVAAGRAVFTQSRHLLLVDVASGRMLGRMTLPEPISLPDIGLSGRHESAVQLFERGCVLRTGRGRLHGLPWPP